MTEYFEARMVAGSATCKQTVLGTLFSHENCLFSHLWEILNYYLFCKY